MLRYSLLSVRRPCFINGLVRRTLFGRRSTTQKIKDDFDEAIIEQPESVPQAAIPTVSELASYKTKQYITRLVTCRPYTPPSNLEQIIYRIANETIDNFKQETRGDDHWKSVYLTNPLNKYNLLTRCMKECSHTMSNMSLNDIKTLEDVYQYFATPVSDANALENLQQSPDLPANVHIQLDAVRFTSETSGFFNGLDAFPQRSTKVVDLWYKKKYPSYPKNEEDPFKDNIY
ncbi:unnamed protein product [Adineta ricciae]|uniref:Large ribosomal subunit protein mL50 n=1 Tax=Adineta ricciae TaxID=249248 RepID=A0A813T9P2_ADIRI|nr:unnamed protein product [Adineta ricciae]CAF0844447.1 unnamed protein product [Adineta ricciae]